MLAQDPHRPLVPARSFAAMVQGTTELQAARFRLEAARAAVLAVHAAAGLVNPGAPAATRLLRAAEGLARAAVVQLSLPKARPDAEVAAAAPAGRRRRPRGRRSRAARAAGAKEGGKLTTQAAKATPAPSGGSGPRAAGGADGASAEAAPATAARPAATAPRLAEAGLGEPPGRRRRRSEGGDSSAVADAPVQDGDEDMEGDATDDEAMLQRFRAEARTALFSQVRSARPDLPQAAMDRMVTAALDQFDPYAPRE